MPTIQITQTLRVERTLTMQVADEDLQDWLDGERTVPARADAYWQETEDLQHEEVTEI